MVAMTALWPLAGLLSAWLVQAVPYPWPHAAAAQPLAQAIAAPPGYERIREPEGSFGDWLRHLPLKPAGTPVRLFDGRLKANQSAQVRVIDMDVGKKDHQQCADAVIRLHAEYLYSQHRYQAICLHATNGAPVPWTDWMAGARPHVHDRKIAWRKDAPTDTAWPSFRRYLDFLFVYAGTYSLAKDLLPVDASDPIQPGDVFIAGGFPGHAVIVVDVAENKRGQRVFLLAQSYMPAQDMHVLRGLPGQRGSTGSDPWYRFPVGDALETPEWTFAPARRMRFRDGGCEETRRR